MNLRKASEELREKMDHYFRRHNFYFLPLYGWNTWQNRTSTRIQKFGSSCRGYGNAWKKDLQLYVEVFGSLSPKTSTEVKRSTWKGFPEITVKVGQCQPQGSPPWGNWPDFKLETNRNQAGLQMAKAQSLEAKAALNRASGSGKEPWSSRKQVLLQDRKLMNEKPSLNLPKQGQVLLTHR